MTNPITAAFYKARHRAETPAPERPYVRASSRLARDERLLKIALMMPSVLLAHRFMADHEQGVAA